MGTHQRPSTALLSFAHLPPLEPLRPLSSPLPATMPFHQWDYLFAIGTIFAALDAFNIVANSFATSVASKSLTMKQATLAAAVMEFAGAVAVGARTADTIKNGIISSDIFEGNAGVQLLAFT